MKTTKTKAIVLSRTDYGEADRIVKVITPSYGKLSLMAKGSRRPKSKLAGAIELFSCSELTVIDGKSEIKTLISGRLIKQYQNIVRHIDRVQAGYGFVRMLNRATEDMAEPEYFDLIEQSLDDLNVTELDLDLINLIFKAGLLRLSGHSPNLNQTSKGKDLSEASSYTFDYDNACFAPFEEGLYSADDIKFLRLVFAGNRSSQLGRVTNYESHVTKLSPLIQAMLNTYIRL